MPVLQAPMAGWTTPELVAAVSEAGGLGSLAAARMSTDALAEAIEAVRARTDRPFAVNFLVAGAEPPPADAGRVQQVLDRVRHDLELPPGRTDLAPPPSPVADQIEAVVEAGVPVVSFAMGDPGPLVERLEAAGAVVMAAASTAEEARQLAVRGVDAIVAQGAEAGGHRTTFSADERDLPPLVGGLVLVPEVVDAVDVPVVAAGGIVDGRGLAAAMALGAAGAQLGTRFLLAEESGIFPAYRERLLGARSSDPIVTPAFTGRPARALLNRLAAALENAGVDPLPWPFMALAAEDIYRAAAERGLDDWVPLLVGQGIGRIDEVRPASEIVADLVTGAAAAIERLVGSAAAQDPG